MPARKPAEPRYVRLTLEWCNRQRKKQGKKPLKRLPKGNIGSIASCPCGSAAGLYVGLITYWDYNNTTKCVNYKLLPKSVKTFVREFDRGHLPQYILNGG